MNVQTLILAMSIPSAVTGFCFWLIQRSLTKRDKEQEEKRTKRQAKIDAAEKKRDRLQYLVIQSVNASLALSEATAKAVQRIPDAHCNGDMDKALDYAGKVKHEQKEFLTKEGIEKILSEAFDESH